MLNTTDKAKADYEQARAAKHDKPTGGQAFPHYPSAGFAPGMTLRQYAAIKLRIPDSGEEWLDEMILKAKRDELAAAALTGYRTFAGQWCQQYGKEFASPTKIAEWAYADADAILKARSA